MEQIFIVKKQNIRNYRFFKIIFIFISLIFLVFTSNIFVTALSIKDASSIILFIFLLFFFVVFALIFLSFNRIMQAKIASIEIFPDRIIFTTLNNSMLKLLKSDIQSIIIEDNFFAGQIYTTISFRVKSMPEQTSIIRNLISDASNLRFDNTDLDEPTKGMKTEQIIDFLKKNYSEYLTIKS
ncbi:MAG: hypothetical protein N3A01_04470 [Bacteroidales bacterium]|nr:hypothetical protein [Bacteroidales bacterium]